MSSTSTTTSCRNVDGCCAMMRAKKRICFRRRRVGVAFMLGSGRRWSRVLLAAGVVLTVVGVGELIGVQHDRREPSCPEAGAAPVTVDGAGEALLRAGFDTRTVDRSELCGDGAVAVLSAGDERYGTRLTCALQEHPIFHPTSVSELPPRADGALHLVVRNVECFLYSPLARVEALRTAMKWMSAAVDGMPGGTPPSSAC